MLQKILYGVLAFAFILAGMLYLKYEKLQSRARESQVKVIASQLLSSIEATKLEIGRYPENFCEMAFSLVGVSDIEVAYQFHKDSFVLSVTQLQTGYTVVVDENRKARTGDPLEEAQGVERLGPGYPLDCD